MIVPDSCIDDVCDRPKALKIRRHSLIPMRGTVFNQFYQYQKYGSWQSWMSLVTPITISDQTKVWTCKISNSSRWNKIISCILDFNLKKTRVLLKYICHATGSTTVCALKRIALCSVFLIVDFAVSIKNAVYSYFQFNFCCWPVFLLMKIQDSQTQYSLPAT